MKWLLKADERHRDGPLFLLRVGIGLSTLILHGWDKITAGPELWEKIGGAMANLGITFAPTFWGFLAAFAESVCALLIVLGLFFRPAALALTFTMFVAVFMHLNLPPENPNAGWSGASHALDLLIVFATLFHFGPGKYSLRTRWER